LIHQEIKKLQSEQKRSLERRQGKASPRERWEIVDVCSIDESVIDLVEGLTFDDHIRLETFERLPTTKIFLDR
jgi:hypothetical protein